jgi:transposase
LHHRVARLRVRLQVVDGARVKLHFILDNYATHKHPKVKSWLEKNTRVHFHFLPTSASWLNLVERLFSELSERQLKRLAVNSVSELIAVIEAYLRDRN